MPPRTDHHPARHLRLHLRPDPDLLRRSIPGPCVPCPETFVGSPEQPCQCDCPADRERTVCRTSGGQRGEQRCCSTAQMCVDDVCVDCPVGTVKQVCMGVTGETDETRCCRPDQTCSSPPRLVQGASIERTLACSDPELVKFSVRPNSFR